MFKFFPTRKIHTKKKL